MPIYTLHLPNATDPARVDAWLVAHGYTLQDGSSIGADGSVAVVTDRDPSADVAAYADAPTPDQQAVATAIGYLKTSYLPKYRAIPAGQRSDQDNALLSIIAILKAQLTP